MLSIIKLVFNIDWLFKQQMFFSLPPEPSLQETIHYI